jgi:hypothetical protein
MPMDICNYEFWHELPYTDATKIERGNICSVTIYDNNNHFVLLKIEKLERPITITEEDMRNVVRKLLRDYLVRDASVRLINTINVGCPAVYGSGDDGLGHNYFATNFWLDTHSFNQQGRICITIISAYPRDITERFFSTMRFEGVNSN